jgi:hypothetical protein
VRLQLRRLGASLGAGLATVFGLSTTGAAEPASGADGAPENSMAVQAAAHTSVYADSDHVTVVTPVATAELAKPADGWAVRGQYLADIVSAASVDIVSTASQRWNEVRHAGALAGSYETSGAGVRVQGSLSSEPDYVSLSAGGAGTLDFAKGSHTALLGYFRSHDRVGRAGTSFDVFSRTLDADAFTAGVTLTLDRSTNLSLMTDLVFERGDSSKPYRYIPMFSASVAPTIPKGASIELVNQERLGARPLEQLPLERQRYALTARLGHRFDAGTLRVDERAYVDSWYLKATTTEARYFFDLSRRFMVWPRARFHAQTGAAFWERAYVGALAADGSLTLPRLRTGDRELGPLATVGIGVGGSCSLGRGAHPQLLRLVLQADVIHTEFFDTLYTTSRNAALVALGVESGFQ